MKVGDGLEAGVEQGPLIDEAAVRKVEEHIEDAKSKGAQVHRRRQAPREGPLPSSSRQSCAA